MHHQTSLWLNKRLMPSLLTLAISTGAAAPLAAAEAPSTEEMWKIILEQREVIQRQNQKIDQLSSQYNKLSNQTEQNTQAVAATAEAVEKAATTGSAVNDWVNRSRFGGYGELHYNNLDANHSDVGSDKNELDLHRFVLFFGHDFNEDIRFFSELEVEHALAGEGKSGEVEVEQMYIDFDLNEQATARAGLFLLPVGILNETHEPTTFYGVERNPVEKNIIPATWWEGGAGVHGQFAPGWGYDVYVHSGLEASAGDKYAPRKGRQKASKALAKDWASTVRIKWTGIPGLELASAVQHQDNISQSQDDDAGSATLLSAHAVYQNGPFGLRALYGQWNLEGDGPESIGADKQDGFYVEPSWQFSSQFGVFARYNQWDNQAGDSSGSEKEQIDVGINYWPHEDVVIKADYMKQDFDDDKGQKGFNLGIGYQF
jgi:hypothetical protein